MFRRRRARPRAGRHHKDGAALVKASFINDLETLRGKFVGLAEAFPQDRYTWRPMEGVRSVSEVLMLAALEGYKFIPTRSARRPRISAAARRRRQVRTLTDKAKIIEHLNKGFAHAKKELEALDPATLTARRKLMGQPARGDRDRARHRRRSARAPRPDDRVRRMNHIVPPWSKRDAARPRPRPRPARPHPHRDRHGDRIRHLPGARRGVAAGRRTGRPRAAGLGRGRRAVPARRPRVRRAGRDEPRRGRSVRLPAGRVRTAHRVSLRLDLLPRDRDRLWPRRSRSRPPRTSSSSSRSGRSDRSWPQSPSSPSSRPSTCAARGAARTSRTGAPRSRSARCS